ncbi:MAG TPA: twitching motility protein PilT [Sphingobacteriaceae bacterium]|nr:twitching motility protein PilT [Sphingobacteriaceae bacterium]
MKVFLDANILVSVLNKEYPVFPFSSRILSLAGSGKFKFFTSPLCLAIAFYFAEKKTGANAAKKKIDLLCKHLNIAANSAGSVSKTLINSAVHDFEDGLEYYAALETGCKCILTEDNDDFYFSEVEVLNCVDFCRKHLTKQTHQ